MPVGTFSPNLIVLTSAQRRYAPMSQHPHSEEPVWKAADFGNYHWGRFTIGFAGRLVCYPSHGMVSWIPCNERVFGGPSEHIGLTFARLRAYVRWRCALPKPTAPKHRVWRHPMTARYYTLNDQGQAVPLEGGIAELAPQIAAMFDNTPARVVAATKVGSVTVSTVFLVIDHQLRDDGPPLLWESMVFGGEDDGYQMRYSSREAAERGHAEIVAMVQERAARAEEQANSGRLLWLPPGTPSGTIDRPPTPPLDWGEEDAQ